MKVGLYNSSRHKTRGKRERRGREANQVASELLPWENGAIKRNGNGRKQGTSFTRPFITAFIASSQDVTTENRFTVRILCRCLREDEIHDVNEGLEGSEFNVSRTFSTRLGHSNVSNSEGSTNEGAYVATIAFYKSVK